MPSNLKPGDPGYGTKDPPTKPKPNPLPNKPSWRDWQRPERFYKDPRMDDRRPPEALPKK